MPPTPQPSTPRPLTIVVCESVPDQRVGNATVSPSTSRAWTTLERNSRFTWWQMPVPGRHHGHAVERLLRPAQELIPLQVALVLLLDVRGEGQVGAEEVDLDRVVDHQVGRQERVDLLRVAAEPRHRRAHRRDVDHGRDAGVVLEQHRRAGTAARPTCRRPASSRRGLDVRPLERFVAVGVAEDVLEQDLDDVRHPLDVPEAGQGRQSVDRDLAAGGFQGCTRAKRVGLLHQAVPHLIESSSGAVQAFRERRWLGGRPARSRRLFSASVRMLLQPVRGQPRPLPRGRPPSYRL